MGIDSKPWSATEMPFCPHGPGRWAATPRTRICPSCARASCLSVRLVDGPQSINQTPVYKHAYNPSPFSACGFAQDGNTPGSAVL
ncbi:Chemotaxis protein methyltransferase Cher2 [Clarias magur]|uniref:Chemotaxis protein methyltransferase Cher2 n=1 Tax=Clarias magur TaxID=1594786 RepID=A0A8J4X9E3_CLAMG|nr:Chemotaxis protein methyltransferase Cher2 [Clarias magur]